MRGTKGTQQRLALAVLTAVAIGSQTAYGATSSANGDRQAVHDPGHNARATGTITTPAGDETERSYRTAALPDLSPYDDSLKPALQAPESRLTGFDRFNGQADQAGAGLWLTNPSQRIKGLGATLAPGNTGGDGFALNTAFLQEDQRSPSGPVSSLPNNVWGIGLSGAFWDRRLTVQGEYAASRQRALADAATPETAGGDAYDLQLALQPDAVALASHSLHWRLSLGRRAADSAFWSPGETPGGELTEHLAGELRWHRVHSSFAIRRSRPRDPRAFDQGDWQRRQLAAQLQYDAGTSDWLPLGRSLFGDSHYTLRMERSADHADARVSRVDTTFTLARFDPGLWEWQLSHARAVGFTDTDEPVHHRDHSSLRLHWPLPGRWRLNPAVFRHVEHWQDSQQHLRTVGGELLATVTLIPDRLDARLNLHSQRRVDEGSGLAEEQARLESAVEWMVRPQRGMQPRIKLLFDGRLETHRPDGGAEPDSQYRVFARFEATWPEA